jgi:hypothetical protein
MRFNLRFFINSDLITLAPLKIFKLSIFKRIVARDFFDLDFFITFFYFIFKGAIAYDFEIINRFDPHLAPLKNFNFGILQRYSRNK